MNLRSVIALLVLANYLLLAVSGYVSRPEQDPFMVLMHSKSAESHRYESRQYMRTDALEAFMVEALSIRDKDTPDAQNQLLFSFTTEVNAHPLPDFVPFQVLPIFKKKDISHHYAIMPLKNIALAVYSPPESPGLA